jgi:hypothetical protein
MMQFYIHAFAWKPFLVQKYGDGFTYEILKEVRQHYEVMAPTIPYIGGNENPMTRILINSAANLILYKVLKVRGKTAEEVGKIIYDATEDSVSHLPQIPGKELTQEFRAKEIELARKSQERRYPDDWVWEFVEGDGVEFDYGRDYLECANQKLYHTHGADEFLPYICYTDFVTERTIGWGFSRTQTLAEGCKRCDFRWKKGGVTQKGWPPPFLTKRVN